MATVSFLLKEPTATKPTPIFAFLSFDGQRIKVYSGLLILPKKWNKGDQRGQLRGFPENGELNDALDLLEKRLLACYSQHRAQGKLPTIATVRTTALPVLEESEPIPEPAPSFWHQFDAWIALTRSKGKMRTAQTYVTAVKHLREFEAFTGYAVDFDTITPSFGDRYTDYLLNEADLTDNTINKQVDCLKRFLRYAVERGFTDTTKFERLTWKRKDPDIMTLTAEEVGAIEELDLTEHVRLDNARSLFLLACYTGLRYSDLVSIRKEHLRCATLRLTTLKTCETVTIPLQACAQELITRYLAGGIRPISNQKLNDYLKEVGQLAGIDSPIEVIRYRGGERVSRTVSKWKKLGCHTGRRTFVTLSLERGLRPEVVMKITGHRDWKSFKRYINITEQAVEREFAKVYEMSAPLLKVVK
ncbi:MAG TPA: site-specific integrase [Hymenobacter sp.]|jgi:site-specific recombinase XerD